MTRNDLEARLERWVRGEKEDPGAVLGGLRAHLLALLMRRRVEANLAEDLVQESLVIFWTKVDTLRQPERALAWAVSIALNRLRSHMAREPKLESMPGPLPLHERSPLARLALRETEAWVRQQLHALRPDVRAAVVLRMSLGHSSSEAASLMGVARPALRRLLHRGLTYLRERALAPDGREAASGVLGAS